MADERAPHLLYVAWGYPPSRGAGMYRGLATANAFARAGWKVTVLTPTRETFQSLTDIDLEIEKAIDPSITVVRVPFDLSRGETDLAKWSRTRISSPLWWSFAKSMRERLLFPEPRYGGWRRFLVPAALAVHRENPVSLVIGTANPHVDFVPGWVLHRRFGVPYVMDYRDTWHLDMYSGTRIGSRWSRSARWEKRMLAKAQEVWFVNAPIRDWHAQEHPAVAERFMVVSNGYDPNFLSQERAQRPDPEAGLVFGYLGTVYGPMPMRETFEGWRLARERSPLIARSSLVIRGRLGHYATPDAEVRELIESYADEAVGYGGKVSKTRVAEVYGGFDALLLILGRSRYITSGKVFEYAATGLPIASLHHPETASTEVLRDHPAWVPAERVDAEAFAEAIVALGERAATTTAAGIARAQEWARRWERQRQLTPRITALTEHVTGGPA